MKEHQIAKEKYFIGPEFARTHMYKLPTLFIRGNSNASEENKILKMTQMKHIHYGYQNTLDFSKVIPSKETLKCVLKNLENGLFVTVEVNLKDLTDFEVKYKPNNLFAFNKFIVLVSLDSTNIVNRNNMYFNINDITLDSITTYTFPITNGITDEYMSYLEDYSLITEFLP